MMTVDMLTEVQVDPDLCGVLVALHDVWSTCKAARPGKLTLQCTADADMQTLQWALYQHNSHASLSNLYENKYLSTLSLLGNDQKPNHGDFRRRRVGFYSIRQVGSEQPAKLTAPRRDGGFLLTL
jgi:hypothetical protein